MSTPLRAVTLICAFWRLNVPYLLYLCAVALRWRPAFRRRHRGHSGAEDKDKENWRRLNNQTGALTHNTNIIYSLWNFWQSGVMKHKTLAGVMVTAALLIFMPMETAIAANNGHIAPGAWSSSQRESSSVFQCGTNQVVVARAHDGDENGNTRYRCASIRWAGASSTVNAESWGPWVKESDGISSWCGANRVVIGREHRGDENGNTRYRCGVVQLGTAQLTLGAPSWTDDIRESNSSYSCPADQVMVGRKHRGDENGQTNYACALLWWDHEATPLIAKGIVGPYYESASRFECGDGEAMTSRKHIGDENALTWYGCSDVTVGGQRARTLSSSWTSGSRESDSDVVCPGDTFITAREHTGDENGNTTYRCSQLAVQGQPVVRMITTGLSPYIVESHSDFTCPSGTAMIQRTHAGDENGFTRYDCASAVIAGNFGVNTQIARSVGLAVGVPAAPGRRADRRAMGIDDAHYLHLDIGGEGWATAHGIESGFRSAININYLETHSQTGDPIPNLVRVESWATSPGYPVADRSVNYITMQGAPLTSKNVSEMARTLRSDGRIDLWVDLDLDSEGVSVKQRIRDLAARLGKTVDWSCVDEFKGTAGNPKTCIA